MTDPLFASFDAVHAALADLLAPDTKAQAAARARQCDLTKPPGALGRLEALAEWYAGWRGDARPRIARPQILVFAASHGVAGRGVSAFPSEVTAQMVANLEAGGAAINQLATTFGARLAIHPLDPATPTADFTTGPAMTERETLAALNTAGAAVPDDSDLLIAGEMGIGNTTPAAALAAALYGGAAAEWVGAGSGLDAAGVAHKASVIEVGLAHHAGALDDPLEVLRRLGGRELAATFGARLAIHPLDPATPTADFTTGPAMTERETLAALNAGGAAVPDDSDLLVAGEMGIGNTTPAAALAAALYGGAAAEWVGAGSGLDAAGVAHKASVIEAGLAHHAGALDDPLEVLRRLGGRELAAIAGAVLAARRARIPVILDGFIATAAAAVLERAAPGALDHAVAGHRSAESAHGALLARLGKAPLLDLGMRLGEGTGAALALGVLQGALACHSGMATFAEAGVSAREA